MSETVLVSGDTIVIKMGLCPQGAPRPMGEIGNCTVMLVPWIRVCMKNNGNLK